MNPLTEEETEKLRGLLERASFCTNHREWELEFTPKEANFLEGYQIGLRAAKHGMDFNMPIWPWRPSPIQKEKL